MTAQDLSAELRQALLAVARTPRLLVACDYDGTLAPIVLRPEDARPLPEAARALRSLAELPNTTGALISGRALRDLATLSRMPAEVYLVGSHGSEFDVGFVNAIDDESRALLGRVAAELERIIREEQPQARIERKPASVAFHVRGIEEQAAEAALNLVREGAAAWDGVNVTEGKSVIELSVIHTDKGEALDILRHQVGATAAVFFGDDVTDERAFVRLHGPDVGVKVGNAATAAKFRVKDPAQVATALAFLSEERKLWLSGGHASPIERLTMLANPRTVALLTPDATVTWLCHPEPDSGAVFAHLLGGAEAGFFSVEPARAALPLSQRYVDGTMTVQTRWASLQVTDYLEHGAPQGRTDLTRVIEGAAKAVVRFAPRPDFGNARISLQVEEDGIRVHGTNDPFVLRSPGVVWTVDEDGPQPTAHAEVDPSSGPIVLELRCGSDDLGPHPVPEPQRRQEAERYWRDWAETLDLPPVKPDLMKRSALTLRGLAHTDSGAILAAATTSLPEEMGGVRNWDYRYCWLRDAAMTASALVSLGSLGEAEGYLAWLHRVLESVAHPERLHPLYTIHGGAIPAEAVIDTLPGYAGSRPVRVGNAADHQVQLDVFGPVVELIAALAAARAKANPEQEPLTAEDWELVVAMVSAVEKRWREPDNGIWEIRGNPRHHVYSKVMCWVTVDRAITLAELHGRKAAREWLLLRNLIREEVLREGWNDTAKSYTAAYDGNDLDAATLHIGLSGLLDPKDDRFKATVLATETELRSGATVYRYHHDDGLPGGEGGFHLCAAWLVEAYLLVGRRGSAEALFDQLVRSAGPTGLLSEEYDPVAERALGNHPQAYSHIGLLRCAQLLSAR
ncbi:trehalose-phosphatase [Segniliparus rugosus]|uniref:Trehalose-phosphatase n=1 Tax=Segniliparus rugosus (strain ATCC BAA-974 / DSM 45345 / CCUG 50838 / CIP 108380 / JCM 13579 / CDC 945) TaxID=679197 RepID=E5XUW1_SEGRC|nr:trehalose-phosphatase [Segniliparus rugosus]EFV11797.1 trehalose-phosphatase [Segniliparus rugosus ATCC BAA-974]